MFLHTEASRNTNFLTVTDITTENVKQDVPVLNQVKLVKFLFESLIKLVPAG